MTKKTKLVKNEYLLVISSLLQKYLLTNICGFDGNSVINTIPSHTNDVPVTFQSGHNATFVYGISSVVTTNLEKKNPEIDSWTNAITHYR